MKKWWLLLLLILILIGLNADQMVISPNISLIEKELRINDAQIGYIASSFTIIGAILSLLWGYLSDKYQRRKLMFWAIFVGEIPCFLSAFAQNYGELFFLRALTGIGKLVGGSLSMVLGSMLMALNISTLFWLVCAFLLIFVVMYIGHDLAKIRLKMEKIAKEMKT